MKKLIDSYSARSYVSPKCKMLVVGALRVHCSSPYGDDGMAGGELNSENTHDYDKYEL